MLCVTIMVVSLLSSTMRSVRSSTNCAVRGSSAAVCSSSSKMRDGRKAAINRLTACRWPPESRPMRSLSRFSSPRPSMARRSRNSSRMLVFTALPKPRRSPRLYARARFSSMVRSSQVPAMGSWNTRATRLARSHTACRVTSCSSMCMVPLSTDWSPDTALSSVDLPAPLEPMTVTNWPAGISSDKPRNARVSIGVPGLNVTLRFFALNMSTPSFAAQALFEQRYDQCHGYQHGRHEIQVLSLQSDKVGVQRQGNEEAVEHGADNNGQRNDGHAPRRHDAFADN